ncbi:class I SAM-dependent methyltransferase [Pacificibacter marinus]|uniref:class I SAM-dependent methyltransferase n=1 Tax=Pacificibacter marinus TaxID=658057 RepID=UPI001C069D53|nr:class I SAM-dependent methyltransferase [Pacificibacter marinus]MBU2866997.1 class I SAM-dependent methyltransferase [Pacificibacter marinus]
MNNFTLKDEIRSFWSDRAADFDLSVSHQIEPQFGVPEWHRFIETAFGLEGAQFNGQKVLDIACGTGEISRVLVGLGADVTAVDFSETMLARAQEKLNDQTWRAVQADAEALHPIVDSTFDFAVTRHLAWTLTNPVTAYQEWRRVLKPGGQLLIVDGNWVAGKSNLQRVKNWIADRISERRPRSVKEISAHRAIVSRLPYGAGLTAERLQADLRLGGFQSFRLLEVDRLYRAGMRGHPIAARLRQSAENRFAMVVQ